MTNMCLGNVKIINAFFTEDGSREDAGKNASIKYSTISFFMFCSLPIYDYHQILNYFLIKFQPILVIEQMKI